MAKPITYVGLDVHKDTIAVALAEAGLRGEVRERTQMPPNCTRNAWYSDLAKVSIAAVVAASCCWVVRIDHRCSAVQPYSARRG